jgi:dihydrofolate synthase/folylpolyglutamate synthase
MRETRMTYAEAVKYLLALGRELAAPRQARVQKFDLDNILVLARHLGEPQRKFPSIHVAGTNGKGSTAAMIEAVLRESGLRTGLYISPHLERINERIQVAGEPVPDDEFARSFNLVRDLIERLLASGELAAHPTYFECLTAMAFETFAEQKVEFAVLEVGMGGRLDATNIVTPEVAVITQIDFDHEDYLGHSIEQIAGEKAAIVKAGVPVVLATERPRARKVVERKAAELGAPVIEIDRDFRLENVRDEDGWYRATAVHLESGEKFDLAPSLAGRYQLRNALAALAAARIVAKRGWPVTRDHIERGIARARWLARLERFGKQPAIYLDGTHNPAGARELVNFWEEHFADRRVFLVYGAMRDKAVDEIAGLLFPRAGHVILTQPRQSRAISVDALAAMSGHLADHFDQVADPAEAVRRALKLAGPDDVVFVTGSLYLAGDLRPFVEELTRCSASAPPREEPPAEAGSLA